MNPTKFIIFAGTMNQISESFRQGMDISLLPWFLLLFLIILVALFGIIWSVNFFLVEGGQGKKDVTVLKALSKNLQLTKGQRQYLDALIERFKNKNPYDPEVSTEYLKTFLEYGVQNLANGPTQTLRRQVHETPELREGYHMEIMFQDNDEWRTLSCEIEEQDGRFVILSSPLTTGETPLREDDLVEVSYRKGDLKMRGDAEVRQLTENNLILFLPEGMHFEQQRSYRRITTPSLDVKFRTEDEEDQAMVIKGSMEDISAEGARVIAEKHPKLHEGLQGTFEVDLPDTRTMDIPSEIVRLVNYDDEHQELGIHFTRVSMANRERIQQYIHRNQAKKGDRPKEA